MFKIKAFFRTRLFARGFMIYPHGENMFMAAPCP